MVKIITVGIALIILTVMFWPKSIVEDVPQKIQVEREVTATTTEEITEGEKIICREDCPLIVVPIE